MDNNDVVVAVDENRYEAELMVDAEVMDEADILVDAEVMEEENIHVILGKEMIISDKEKAPQCDGGMISAEITNLINESIKKVTGGDAAINLEDPSLVINSYVKFLDSGTLVSASTDNTLKLWDLNKASYDCLSTSSCILTYKGHTNEKNFVGLSVADGYIACGSETNEVFAYHRSLPMPITSYKFGSIDPITGKETENETNQFVSSVCWRQKSEMVVAANSSGCLKLLQMV